MLSLWKLAHDLDMKRNQLCVDCVWCRLGCALFVTDIQSHSYAWLKLVVIII